MGRGLSLLGTVFQLGVVAGMAPPDWRLHGVYRAEWVGHGFGLYPLFVWAPHIENLGEGRPAFLGGRCPGRQLTGVPFQIAEYPLPVDYDPHGYPNADVVACFRLDSRGAIERVQLVNGTGRAALDRRLLRELFREWRFVPADQGGGASAWQRVRLNSADRSTPPPLHEPDPLLL